MQRCRHLRRAALDEADEGVPGPPEGHVGPAALLDQRPHLAALPGRWVRIWGAHFRSNGSFYQDRLGTTQEIFKIFKKNAIHLRRWRALVELKKAGKIKAIGVSNWMLSNLKRMKSLGLELPAVRRKLQFNVL